MESKSIHSFIESLLYPNQGCGGMKLIQAVIEREAAYILDKLPFPERTNAATSNLGHLRS